MYIAQENIDKNTNFKEEGRFVLIPMIEYCKPLGPKISNQAVSLFNKILIFIKVLLNILVLIQDMNILLPK